MIAPTRELAVQISEVLENAGKPVGLTALCVYGGVPKHPQVSLAASGSIWRVGLMEANISIVDIGRPLLSE